MATALQKHFVAATLALITGHACAWGTQGHHIIAALAQSQLSPAARQEVDRLLALEPEETLETISIWADEHRNPATAAWHYVNFPRDSCTYDASRDCPDGKCVVAAIEKQTAILASNAPDEKRLLALKYVVHLVADVHQPLHAGYKEDRGGNNYQLQAFMRGSNLHAVWDTGLIKSLNLETASIVKSLLVRPLPNPRPAFTAATAVQESCRIVGKTGFYPDRLVKPAYIGEYTPVMLFQLALAGARLAEVLNQVARK